MLIFHAFFKRTTRHTRASMQRSLCCGKNVDLRQRNDAYFHQLRRTTKQFIIHFQTLSCKRQQQQQQQQRIWSHPAFDYDNWRCNSARHHGTVFHWSHPLRNHSQLGSVFFLIVSLKFHLLTTHPDVVVTIPIRNDFINDFIARHMIFSFNSFGMVVCSIWANLNGPSMFFYKTKIFFLNQSF